jgi:hypothetical protein
MARANLQQLLGKAEDSPPRSPSHRPTQVEAPTSQVEARDTPSMRSQRRPAPPKLPRDDRPDGPLFSALQRKETRIREDQQNALTMHARRLSKAKGTGGRRITDNTLIRVAVDLLLVRADDLAGATEDELRRSLGH